MGESQNDTVRQFKIYCLIMMLAALNNWFHFIK